MNSSTIENLDKGRSGVQRGRHPKSSILRKSEVLAARVGGSWIRFERGILLCSHRILDEELVTLLMASHDSLVDEYADEILQLKGG